MKPELKAKILEILDDNRLMTVATLRPDGWPQATTVGYANEGLEIYFLCGTDSQKATNLAHDNRVSITIDHDTTDPMAITGLSLAAHAMRIDDEAEIAKFFMLLGNKYPEYRGYPAPEPGTVRCFRVRPEWVSVLDYTKGFGHTDLVEVDDADLTPG